MHGVKPWKIESALAKYKQFTWVDVRSENEFAKAHIPTAINIPILSNSDRVAVGTCYKQSGRIAAVRLGLELVGPKFPTIYDQLLELYSNGKPLLFYCWRGGLRSQIASTLMYWAGESVNIIEGGYKSYRNWALQYFEKHQNFVVLSGCTGSGKTQILHELRKENLQVLDFEGLAHHKGSVLGGIGQLPQPSTEHFENLIAFELLQFEDNKPIVVENESRRIGSCILPEVLWKNMQNVRAIEITTDINTRIDRLYAEYANLPINKLKEQTAKLAKRLGGQNEKLAQQALDAGDFRTWISILLVYYDKAYTNYQALFNHQIESISIEWLGENKNQIDPTSLEEIIKSIYNES
ncbi:MAG: tRNA 2-selenouridine(34) synthase MnmH [Bacteroidota bacterium]|jgi:tRNA 2-selenouridine synthase